jgi:hypothetical protein
VRAAGSGCCFLVSIAPIEFVIDGIGSGTFNDPAQAVINQTNGAAGFGTILTNRAVLFTVAPEAFAGYDLRTSIGPIVGGASFNPGFSFATSAGPLRFDLITGTTTFRATVVPLPNAAWLLVTALGGLAWLRRRR